MNYINYKKTVSKLHDDGMEKSYFTSADVSLLGYGCGVFQYPHIYDKGLDMYQLLQHTYIGSFDGFLGEKLILKMGVIIGKSGKNVCLGMY